MLDDLVYYSVEVFWGSVAIVAGLIIWRLVIALSREQRSHKYNGNTKHKLHV